MCRLGGFETVWFYQSLFSFAKYIEFYIAAGLVNGLVAIVGVNFFLVRKLGKRLPLRSLFELTIAVGCYMSITFIGNAIREISRSRDILLLLNYLERCLVLIKIGQK